MHLFSLRAKTFALILGGITTILTPITQAADKELLDVLLQNGIITQVQYDDLMKKASLSSKDILSEESAEEDTLLDAKTETAIADAVSREFEAKKSPIEVSHGSKGFKLATRDGNWETNLQWRAQLRYTNPFRGDPRQLDDFDGADQSNFEARRLRMKIGGHGYKPWLKYYFEVDLQPSRDDDDDGADTSARVIDWRIDLAKWDALGFRFGQWKIDLNRERVDSSSRQQFVERSIVNRIFTIDRQVGAQVKGHLFQHTPADLRYWAGIFNGEGRGVNNNGNSHMYMGRLQWNFLGRDLAWKQTDVEYTELPTGSFAIGGATNEGACTRWSSSGCGNLDGFTRPGDAEEDQFKIDQYVQELAFKYRGFSFQQEYHRKDINDRVLDIENELTGFYTQSGYFFHHLFPSWPSQLELAARYAYVEEPNQVDRTFDNEREEYTLAANWFFKGHNNKLTLDYSYLTIDDDLLNEDDNESRIRLQWDVSY